MWEFLGNVAGTYGFGALIALIALGGMGFAVRELWKRNKELANGPTSKRMEAIEDQLKELVRVGGDIRTLRDEHGIQLAALRKEFTERLTVVQGARQDETAAYARRVDELQEKRLSEMKEVVTAVVRSSIETNTAVGKISDTMDTLTDVMARGGR